jgi:O-antigen ligase
MKLQRQPLRESPPTKSKFGWNSKSVKSGSEPVWISYLTAISMAMLLSPSAIAFLFSSILPFSFPWPFIIIALNTICLVLNIFYGRIIASHGLVLALIISYYEFTGLWSPSYVYWQDKAITTAILPFLCFFAGQSLALSYEDTKRFLKVLVGFGFILVTITLVSGIDVATSYDGLGEQAVLGYQSLSRVLGFACVALFALSLEFNRNLIKTLGFVACAGIIGVMLFTGGRTGLLVVAIFFVSYTFMSISPALRLISAATLLIILAIASTFDVQGQIDAWSQNQDLPASISRMLYYLSSSSVEKSYDIGGRDQLHELAWIVWSYDRIWGVGWGGFTITAGLGDILGNYPHNIVLELLAETGLVGAALSFVVTGILILKFWHKNIPYNQKKFLISFLCSAFGIAWVIADIPYQRELFMVLGVLSGVVAGKNWTKAEKFVPVRDVRKH